MCQIGVFSVVIGSTWNPRSKQGLVSDRAGSEESTSRWFAAIVALLLTLILSDFIDSLKKKKKEKRIRSQSIFLFSTRLFLKGVKCNCNAEQEVYNSTRFLLLILVYHCCLYESLFAIVAAAAVKPQNALFRAAKHYWKSFCTFAVNGKCAKMGARAVAEMVLDVTLIGVGEMVVNGVSSAF